jgi:hypothetical protein
VGPRLLLAAERPQGHAEGTEAVGLPVGVVQLPADGQALPQAVERVLVAPLPLVDAAEVAQAERLAAAVVQLLVEGEALPQSVERLLVAPQPLVDLADVAETDGQAEAVAQLPLDGQALLMAGRRVARAVRFRCTGRGAAASRRRS